MFHTYRKMKTALIGSGMISGTYLRNCVRYFNILDVVGCSDIIPERAAVRAAEFGIRAMTNDEILSDPAIELVINTTFPAAHYEVSKAAMLAGKHVYCEKMLAVTLEQAHALRQLSADAGRYLGGAPDTFLGAGMQTARVLVDGGLIGEPVAAEFVLARGYRHNEFREDPEKRFAFCPGGGILFDMGCYYLTVLVSLLGPIESVTGFEQTRAPERPYLHPKNPLYGRSMTVESPNQAAGALQFQNGVLCSLLVTSEGVNVTNHFTLFGTSGTLTLGDPNGFGGPVLLRTKDGGEETPIPLTHAWTEDMRGLGAADLAYAVRNGRAPRCGADLIFHVFEAAWGLGVSCRTGEKYRMTSTCRRPAPLEAGHTEYPEAALDL